MKMLNTAAFLIAQSLVLLVVPHKLFYDTTYLYKKGVIISNIMAVMLKTYKEFCLTLDAIRWNPKASNLAQRLAQSSKLLKE